MRIGESKSPYEKHTFTPAKKPTSRSDQQQNKTQQVGQKSVPSAPPAPSPAAPAAPRPKKIQAEKFQTDTKGVGKFFSGNAAEYTQVIESVKSYEKSRPKTIKS